MRVAEAIRTELERTLAPEHLEIIDESHRHAGHAGARPEGESHFRLVVVARAFDGVSRIERQRLVHAALADLLREDIHALQINAFTPAEWQARQSA